MSFLKAILHLKNHSSVGDIITDPHLKICAAALQNKTSCGNNFFRHIIFCLKTFNQEIKMYESIFFKLKEKRASLLVMCNPAEQFP